MTRTRQKQPGQNGVPDKDPASPVATAGRNTPQGGPGSGDRPETGQGSGQPPKPEKPLTAEEQKQLFQKPERTVRQRPQIDQWNPSPRSRLTPISPGTAPGALDPNLDPFEQSAGSRLDQAVQRIQKNRELRKAPPTGSFLDPSRERRRDW